MSLTESSKLALGTKVPNFFLPDVLTSKNWSLSEVWESDRPLLIIFMCNHCPYVKHVEEEISRIGKDYVDKIAVMAVSSNDVAIYPDDSPENLREQAHRLGFNFPYFYDDRQEFAKALKATCTPDFYLFTDKGELYYHGQLDEARPGSTEPNDGHDLRNAINSLLDNKIPPKGQKPSMGCNIKWKQGNEPDYFK